MKGFKNSTKTQSGHGYDEVPTRPATSKDVAAAKAVRIITPGKSASKPAPRVTTSMILGESEDKAPGERGGKTLLESRTERLVSKANRDETGDRPLRYLDKKEFADWTSRANPNARKLTTDQLKSYLADQSAKPKRFAVGGMVPPVASGGMPAIGKPLTAQNTNDGRLAPPRPAPRPKIMPVASRAPLIKSVGRPAERMTPPAEFVSPNYKSVTTPDPRPIPSAASDPKLAAVQARRLAGPPEGYVPTPVYKKGGKVVEKGSKEVYASKAAMKKHEASESKAKERTEKKQEGGDLLAGRAQSLRDMASKPTGRAGYAKGGKSRWS